MVRQKVTEKRINFNIISILAVLCFLSCIFFHFSPRNISFTSDAALTFAVGDHVLKGHVPLLGAPSHSGGRHLGPLYYYLTAGLFLLGGMNIFFSHIAYAVFLLLGIAAWTFLFFKISKSNETTLLSTAIFLSSILTSRFIELFRYYWQPHFFIVATPFFLLSLIRWRENKKYSFLQLLLTASCMVQIHYGAAPILFAGIISFVLFSKKQPASESQSRVIQIFYVLVLLLLWAPALWYEFLIEHNLFRTLFPHVVTDGASTFPLTSSIAFFINFLKGEISFLGLIQVGAKALKYFVYLIIGVLCLAGIRTQKTGSWIYPIIGTYLLSAIGYIFLLSRMSGDIHLYYLYPMLCIAPFIFSFLIANGIVSLQIKGSLQLKALACFFVLAIGMMSLRIITSSKSLSLFSIESSSQIASFIPKVKNSLVTNVTIKSGPVEAPLIDAVRFFIGPTQYSQMQGWEKLKEFSSPQDQANKQRVTWDLSCQRSRVKNEDAYQIGKCRLLEIKDQP